MDGHIRRSSWASMIALAIIVASAIAAAAPVSAADQPSYMVKNIRPGSRSSNPSNLTAIGNRLYFTATDGKHGREPWVSDGTASGTHMIKNISPGSYSSNPRDYTRVGNIVFFTAQDGNGRELWKTDGTAAGTVRVKDIRPGDKSSKPSWLTAVGSTLYLSANDGPHGPELWKSDGTAAGTVMVVDRAAGKLGVNPMHLTAFHNHVYFIAPNVVIGLVAPPRLLYRSDGTAAGTHMVASKYGSEIIEVSDLTVSGSYLYFSAGANELGTSLWRTDGTKLGTKPISDPIEPDQLTDVAGTLFFTAEPGLWKTSGTRSTTTLIKPVNDPSQLTAAGGYLYYTTVDDDVTQSLRVSDGTNRAVDSWSAANWGNGYAYGNLTDVAGTLFVSFGSNENPENQFAWDVLYMDCSLYDGDCTQYLWQRRAIPLDDGHTTIRRVHDLTAVGDTLYFVAADAAGMTGTELWHFSLD